MLSLKLHEIQFGNGSIVLEITNNLPKTVNISRDTILLDGFTSNKFCVKDKSTNENLIYKGVSAKYRPKKIDIKDNERLESELDLKDVYDLKKCHSYEVSFETIAIIEDGIENLSGIVNIDMEC